MPAVGGSRLPGIVVPMTVLATLDEHDVTLLTVELWPDRVRLRVVVGHVVHELAARRITAEVRTYLVDFIQ